MTSVYFTEKESKSFESTADKVGMSRSELGRSAANGLRAVHISDEVAPLLEEVRALSAKASRIGNLFRLNATMLEIVAQNPSLTEGDKAGISQMSELLTDAEKEFKAFRADVKNLRSKVMELYSNGNIQGGH